MNKKNLVSIIFINMKSALIASLALFLSITAQAQFSNGCVDSSLIRTGAYCDPQYIPVCGCDQKTYRNYCFAMNEGLVNYSDGICEDLAIDINPNPVVNTLKLKIVSKYQADVTIYIIDYFGKYYYQQRFDVPLMLPVDINVNYYPYGMYNIIAEANGKYIFKKLIKYSN